VITPSQHNIGFLMTALREHHSQLRYGRREAPRWGVAALGARGGQWLPCYGLPPRHCRVRWRGLLAELAPHLPESNVKISAAKEMIACVRVSDRCTDTGQMGRRR
jgi:hypothetical protein